MTADPLADLSALQQRIRDTEATTDALRNTRAELIATARAAGHSWPTIGRALSMSHVAAMKAARA